MNTLYTDRLIIVVPKNAVPAALAQMKRIDPQGGDHALTVGLSATGAEPATHYWCSWALTADEAVELNGYMAGTGNSPQKPKVYDGNVRTPQSVLDELGLRRVGSDVG